MTDEKQNFLIEYSFTPSPDAEAQLAQAYEVILNLILDELEKELEQTGETC